MTAIYVIAALVVLVFLYGAYRMMGAGATVEEDPRAVLAVVLGTATEAAQVLDGTPGTGDDAKPHAVRRRLDGCAQALERIAGIPVNATLDEARTALELAVDELSWAARLAEAPGYARDNALSDAGTSLRSRASANLERARSQLDG